MTAEAAASGARGHGQGPAESDERLWAQAQAGDAEAVAVLYGRHRAAGFAVAQRLLGDGAAAEDAVHTAFCALLGRRGAMPARARPFLLGMVINSCRNRLRSERAGRRRGLEVLDKRCAPPPADQSAVQEAARAALARLPPAMATLLWQRFAEERSLAELAEAAAAPPKTVETRIRRSLILLRRALARDGVTEAPQALALLLGPAGSAPSPPLVAHLSEVLAAGARPAAAPAAAASTSVLGAPALLSAWGIALALTALALAAGLALLPWRTREPMAAGHALGADRVGRPGNGPPPADPAPPATRPTALTEPTPWEEPELRRLLDTPVAIELHHGSLIDVLDGIAHALPEGERLRVALVPHLLLPWPSLSMPHHIATVRQVMDQASAASGLAWAPYGAIAAVWSRSLRTAHPDQMEAWARRVGDASLPVSSRIAALQRLVHSADLAIAPILLDCVQSPAVALRSIAIHELEPWMTVTAFHQQPALAAWQGSPRVAIVIAAGQALAPAIGVFPKAFPGLTSDGTLLWAAALLEPRAGPIQHAELGLLESPRERWLALWDCEGAFRLLLAAGAQRDPAALARMRASPWLDPGHALALGGAPDGSQPPGGWRLPIGELPDGVGALHQLEAWTADPRLSEEGRDQAMSVLFFARPAGTRAAVERLLTRLVAERAPSALIQRLRAYLLLELQSSDALPGLVHDYVATALADGAMTWADRLGRSAASAPLCAELQAAMQAPAPAAPQEQAEQRRRALLLRGLCAPAAADLHALQQLEFTGADPILRQLAVFGVERELAPAGPATVDGILRGGKYQLLALATADDANQAVLDACANPALTPALARVLEQGPDSLREALMFMLHTRTDLIPSLARNLQALVPTLVHDRARARGRYSGLAILCLETLAEDREAVQDVALALCDDPAADAGVRRQAIDMLDDDQLALAAVRRHALEAGVECALVDLAGADADRLRLDALRSGDAQRQRLMLESLRDSNVFFGIPLSDAVLRAVAGLARGASAEVRVAAIPTCADLLRRPGLSAVGVVARANAGATTIVGTAGSNSARDELIQVLVGELTGRDASASQQAAFTLTLTTPAPDLAQAVRNAWARIPQKARSEIGRALAPVRTALDTNGAPSTPEPSPQPAPPAQPSAPKPAGGGNF